MKHCGVSVWAALVIGLKPELQVGGNGQSKPSRATGCSAGQIQPATAKLMPPYGPSLHSHVIMKQGQDATSKIISTAKHPIHVHTVHHSKFGPKYKARRKDCPLPCWTSVSFHCWSNAPARSLWIHVWVLPRDPCCPFYF